MWGKHIWIERRNYSAEQYTLLRMIMCIVMFIIVTINKLTKPYPIIMEEMDIY